MAGEWEDLTLGDLGRVVTGKTPLTAVEGNFGGQIPFVTPSDMDGRKTISTTVRYLTEIGAASVKGSKIPAGSVLVSCIGSDMGKAVIAGRDCVTNQQINSIVVDDRFSSEFVYYNLSTRKCEIRHQAAGGSAQPILNKGDFSRLEIAIPPLAEQKAIAAVLGALDDKIELNRRMNATLEAMARALFQSWFVDFDPVRAKLDGRKPRGMDAATVELFPAGFWETPLGNVPDGWPVKPLSQIMIGKNARVGVLDVPEYSSTNDGLHPRTERFTKKLSASTAANKLIHEGDFVFGLSRQLLNFGLMKDNCGCVSPAYKVFTVDRNSIVPDLLELMMRQRPAYFFNAVSSSSREGQSISSDALGRLLVLQPARAVQDAFYELTKPYQQLRIAKELESETLATLRDTLLPKLLSGELSVGDTTLNTGANL